MARNVLGGELEQCSLDPLTGFYRDGCCDTGGDDDGVHTVCAVMTSEFLEFSRAHGNDLSTPMPAHGFAGLQPGDSWCLCASRWQEAYEAGARPRFGCGRRTRARSSGARSRRCKRTPPRKRDRGADLGSRAFVDREGDVMTTEARGHESIRIASLICFYNEHVDISVDGEPQVRPNTPFS